MPDQKAEKTTAAWRRRSQHPFRFKEGSSLLRSLRCPFCSGTLSSFKADQTRDEAEYDILACYCSRYPVVAGIPVLKKGIIGSDGKTSAEVIALIEAGRYREALLSMIMPSPPDSSELLPAWIQSLPSIKGIRRLKHLSYLKALSRWQEKTASALADPEKNVVACDLLGCYFRQSGLKKNDTSNYFAYRFGQPRHLMALSFASVIEQPRKPILDLGCGFGHLTPTLVQRAKGQSVIGMDGMFFYLYMAKHWIAPQATYVCCLGEPSLPFPDEAFSTAFCSDAFYYFTHKAASIRELKRITRNDGLIMLIVLRNPLFKHRSGGEPLLVEGYQALVADMPHRLVSNNAVLNRYLQRQGPSLVESAEAGDLAQEPTFSVIISHRGEVFRDYGRFEEWPHAEGRLELNPLYVEEKRDGSGNAYFRRRFPAPWYEEDNAECKQYLPEVVCINSKTLLDLANGKRTQEMEKLIERCVLLGMPERYR